MSILVGDDGSTAARQALGRAKKRSKRWGAKIEVVKCMARRRGNDYSDPVLNMKS